MPPRRLITLEGSPHILLCPLPVVTSVNNNLILQFALSEHRGSKTRYIACAQRAPLLPGPRPVLPLLLELLGQIAVTDCYLTSRGYTDPGDPHSKPIASCWIEARPDLVSEIYWRSVLPTIQTFKADIPGAADISDLLSVASDGSVRVKVRWEPDADEVSSLISHVDQPINLPVDCCGVPAHVR